MAEPIKVEGLREFRANLLQLDRSLGKALRVAANEAAEIVLAAARPKVPTRTGRARASIKARSTQTAVRVVAGGTRAPYYPWLDFGGRVGPNRSVRRPFLSDGRYIYAAFHDHRDEFTAALSVALVDVARQAGIEVT